MGDAASFRRGVELLTMVGSDEALAAGGLGVSALAQRIGLDKGQVSRMLRILADQGFVERDPTTLVYRPGWALFTLAARAGDQRLLSLAAPALARLAQQVGERAHLSVRQGTDAITVLTESPQRAVQTAGWVGHPVALHCTSTGRALLFDHDRAALGVLFGDGPLEAFGPGAPRDLDDLHARILRARRDRVAIVEDEFESGLVGAAAPIRDAGGRIIAALNLSAPRFRIGAQVRPAALATRVAADDLTRRLAGHPEGTAPDHLGDAAGDRSS